MITFLVSAMLLAIPAPVQDSLQSTQNRGKSKQEPVTFSDSIEPILKENCSPCHFKGGKVYEEYPFDKYETARDLGKRLNSRLKGENADSVLRWIETGSPDKKENVAKKP